MRKNALPISKAKTAYELLSDVRKLILAEPKRYDQGTWLEQKTQGDTPRRGFPKCGTVACVAGWVATLRPPPEGMNFLDVQEVAWDVLGLTGLQSHELFDATAAGDEMRAQTQAHAKRGAAHIAAFQKKYAAQLKAKKV